MKDLERIAGVILVGILLVGAVACSKSGSDGQPGAPGAPGTNVTVVTTPSTPNTVTAAQDLPGLKVAVTSLTGGSGAGGAFLPGDTITVHFTLKKNDGTTLLVSELTGSGIIVSGPSFNYQHVIPRIKNFHTSVTTEEDGSYSYTFLSPIPATYANPDNYTGKYPDAVLAGQALLDGTYTLGIYAYRTYYDATTSYSDVGNSETDFLLGGATTLEPREVAKNDNCNSCHATLQIHGGSRRDVKLCILCHTSGGEDGDNVAAIDFRVMIHKLHNASHLPSVLGVQTNPDGSRNYAATAAPYVLAGTDFSDINFPVFVGFSIAMPRNLGYSALTSAQKTQNDNIRKGAVACGKCHGDPDGAGPKTAPAQGSLCYSQPSRRACGSCHDDIDWTLPYVSNGSTMPAQGNDGACALCHVPSGTSFGTTEVHVNPVLNTTLNPGVKFNLASVAGGTGAGGNFQAGDPLTVNFTVKTDAGADIPVASLDSCSIALVGPNPNRQYVTPNSSVNPFDFSGRLAASVTKDRATMSKGFGAAVTEVLTAVFTSATAYDVTGSVSGALGSGSLVAGYGTNPSKSTITAVELTSAAVKQAITVTFSDATHFDVSGSVSGAMGSGVLPATISATTRFTSTDGSVSFTVTVDTTAFAAGNKMYLSLFKGDVANPVLFAIVAPRTSATAPVAGERFYCEVVNVALTAYSYKVPMDLSLELLGRGDGTTTQTNLVAANLPVYYGRQTLYERTALAGVATTLSAAAAANDRFVTVAAIDAGLATNDFVVLEDTVSGKEEYVSVSSIDTTARKIGISPPLRYSHAAGATFQEATLTFRQYVANYTLDSASGVVTPVVAFGSGNPVVLSYRSDAKWGWKRAFGDTPQAGYYSPIGNDATYDQSWGEWTNLPYLSGTYSIGIWGYKSLYVAQWGEVQAYRRTANAATKDILYGTATTVEPRAAISSQYNCNACHDDVLFHGGGRRGADACLFCHGEAGGQLATGETIDFRTFLHKIHRGSDLANAATFVGGSFAEVGYPAMPGGTKHCATCHGAANTAWKEPADRVDPAATSKTRTWRAVCGSCHDSDPTAAHINLMTDASGTESCTVCHGAGTDQSVELKHKNR